MRKGLINASGTKFQVQINPFNNNNNYYYYTFCDQLNGAAYGNGIYLSPNAGTSFGYSNRYYYNPSNTKKVDTGRKSKRDYFTIFCRVILVKIHWQGRLISSALQYVKVSHLLHSNKHLCIFVILCPFPVVTSKELKRSGDVWVCPNSDHVVTRFFFVYDRHTHDRAFSLHTENKAFRQEIMHAIEVARKRKHDTNSGKGKK